MSTIKLLSENQKVNKIICIHHDKNSNKVDYKIKQYEKVIFFKRSENEFLDIFNLLNKFKPQITYISGWQDFTYVKALRKYRKKNKTISVCGIDDQWWGKPRQVAGFIYFKFFLSSLYDFYWISGKPQYEYVRRLGAKSEKIIYNLYSADNKIFKKSTMNTKRFIFLGRFARYKALDMLIKVYTSLDKKVQKQWPLVLIGDGEMKKEILKLKNKNIFLKGVLSPEQINDELNKGGVGCFVSHRDQWGVAIQEFALKGLPLIVSSAAGAASEFVISDYNGYLFKRSDKTSLRDALMKIIKKSDDELNIFSKRSYNLAKRINPEQSAYSLLSVLHNNNFKVDKSLFDFPEY